MLARAVRLDTQHEQSLAESGLWFQCWTPGLTASPWHAPQAKVISALIDHLQTAGARAVMLQRIELWSATARAREVFPTWCLPKCAAVMNCRRRSPGRTVHAELQRYKQPACARLHSNGIYDDRGCKHDEQSGCNAPTSALVFHQLLAQDCLPNWHSHTSGCCSWIAEMA